MAWLVRQYPTEIETTLLPKADILDWHRGRLSSRRVLVLLRHSASRGPFKTALREGDFDLDQQLMVDIHAELSMARYSIQAAQGIEEPPDPERYLSTKETADMVADKLEQAELDDDASDDLLTW